MSQYNPSVPPQIDEELLPYLSDEFHRVAQAFNGVLSGQWDIHYTLPLRLKPGYIGYFAANVHGTEGIWRYGTTGWVFVG